MTALEEAMRQIGRDLASAFEASGVYKHSLTKGESREEVVARLLGPYLPRRFDISSGEVVNAAGEVSRQQDVVISDSNAVAPLFTTGSAGIHPVEAVHACIEIKSSVDTREVEDAVASLATVRALMPDTPRSFSTVGAGVLGMGETTAKPYTAILAYTASASWETIAKAFYSANRQLSPLNRCEMLAVVGQFVCVWTDGQGMLVPAASTTRLGVKLEPELVLLMFYASLYHRIAEYRAPIFDIGKYLAAVPVSPEWRTLEATSSASRASGGLIVCAI